ncbi:Spx/MgsR family transcriptional regulator [Albidovulum inexpectatum]|uniref:Spx/MgsR family transcriptional regulator n=1 Tax=Albidovulum inexpectatum TaxID=196587 RepID=A0A2S5JFH0_9RHOB|nr:ArsC/Spx/MgsR family protein [Albidovulum inexpectatum]PPB80170.1 Spx/MgsR family transcriptional regulator [Albidovulum inexpectatum]
MILYGVKTCDTCRKAMKALGAAGHDVTFRDVRAEPLGPEDIDRFLSAFGDRLVNRSSTTWRGLDESERQRPAAELLAKYPTLMKRPLIDAGGTLHLGWTKDVQAALLG